MAKTKYQLSRKKELYYILLIVMLAGILLISFLGPGGYRDLRKARLELQAQRTRVDELKRSNNERMKSIEGLRYNKDSLERYAREKGYGRDDEIIQQLPKESEEKH
jgi:cell division protein FtsB